MDNDLIFGNEANDMLAGTGAGDDIQVAAATINGVPYADALTRPFDAAQVVIPEGENIVRIPVAPGEVVELPFPADAQFLARIDNGNLAIKVGDVTVILQGYVEAAGQATPTIEASNGQPLDIATILASTDPNIEIETAAGPAAGPQGQGADNTGAFFAQFGEGGGLGGFTGVGAQDGTDGLGGGTVDQTGTLFVLFGEPTAATALVNTAPTAPDFTDKTDEDHPVSGAVVGTDPEGDPLTYSTVGAKPLGLTFKADGTWTFDPTVKGYDALQVGQTDKVTFQYVANDGTSNSNVGTVTIDIDGVNDAPRFVTGNTQLGDAGGNPLLPPRYEDEADVYQNIGNASGWEITDPDDTTHTITVDPTTLPPGVTYNQATGKLIFATKGHYDYLAEGQTETFVIKFTITDGHGGTTQQDYTLVMGGKNDAPVAAADTVLTNVGLNTTFTIPAWALTANDKDPDDSKLDVTFLSVIPGDASISNFDFVNIQLKDSGALGFQLTNGVSDDDSAFSTTTAEIKNQAGGDLTGGAGHEILIGTSGAEKISAGAGNDIVVGNGGGDEIFGQGGDDTLVFSGAAGTKIDGGTDNVATKDGLEGGASLHGDVLASAEVKLDFSDHAGVANIHGIETISTAASVGGSGAQSVTIGAASVQDISDHTITPGGVFPEKDAVRIDGDAVDSLYLSISKDGGNWVDTGVVSNGYHVFAHETTGGDPTTTDAYVMVQTSNVANVHLNQDAP